MSIRADAGLLLLCGPSLCSPRTLLYPPPFPVAAPEYSLPCKPRSGCGLRVLPPSLPGKTPTYSVEAYVIFSLSWLPDNYHLKKKLFLSSSTLASFQVNSSVWFTHLCWESPGSSYSRTVILRAKLKKRQN